MRRSFRIALLALALCAAACSKSAPKGPAAGSRPVAVSVATVERRDVPVYLEGLGSVVASRNVLVRTQVDGRLDQVFFREGQRVREGEPLAQIDPRPFLAQLHQAEGALMRDRAALETSRRNLERYEELARQKLIAPQQADDQRGLVGQGEGTVRLDEAAVETAKLNLRYARIVAPTDGVVGIRAVDPGNVVHAADATGLVQLTLLDPIAVIFTLPQDVLPQVQEQMGRGPLEVLAFNRDGTRELGRGRLEVIDNLINPTTATLRLKALLPNPQRALWPNAFVKARLQLEARKDALVAPVAALQRAAAGTLVYVVRADQTVEARTVRVALQQGPDALIAQGLEAGELVVTEGQNQLRAGSAVSTRSAPPRAAGREESADDAGGSGEPPKAAGGGPR